jgi:hypothetical protein
VAQAKVQLNQDLAAGNPSVRVIEAPTQAQQSPLLIIAGSVFAAILLAGATVFVPGLAARRVPGPGQLEKAVGCPFWPHRSWGEPEAGRLAGRLHAAIDAHADRDAKSILLVTDTSFRALAALGWATFTGASLVRC